MNYLRIHCLPNQAPQGRQYGRMVEKIKRTSQPRRGGSTLSKSHFDSFIEFKQVFFIEINFSLLQHAEIFFAKRFSTVVLFLLHDVWNDTITLGFGIGKSTESILPMNFFFVNPWSLIHFDEPDLISRTKSEMDREGSIPKKVCTWSFHPFTANGFCLLPVIMPDMYS